MSDLPISLKSILNNNDKLSTEERAVIELAIKKIQDLEYTFDHINDLALTDEQIGEMWDWDLSERWVREKLASRLTDRGYVVIPVNKIKMRERNQ